MFDDPRLAVAAVPPRRRPRHHLRDALLTLAGPHARLLGHQEKSWASITFAGTRHRLELLFEGAEAVAAGELFIAYLPEHEFDLPGRLVADATVTDVDHRLDPPLMRVTCELLVLDER